RHAPARARGLHRVRSRRAVPARRLSRRRGCRARAVPQPRPGETPRGLRAADQRPPARRRGNRRPRRGRLRPGGPLADFLATRLPTLAAAAPFYGMAAPLEDVPKIKAELLVVLAANDERINAAWPAYEDALKKSGVRYALFQPAGTEHGFNNDTTPRYDE